MIPLSDPEIEGGSPERDSGEEGEGLVLEYSSSWICFIFCFFGNLFDILQSQFLLPTV